MTKAFRVVGWLMLTLAAAGCAASGSTQAQQPASATAPTPTQAPGQLAAGETFNHWLAGIRLEALAQGISEATLDAALKDLTPNDKVVALDRNQPERKLTSREYLARVINDARIKSGRARMTEHRVTLQEVAARYDVPAPIIVALWGIETDYGRIGGEFSVIRSLATLAYEGRRSEFFRKELISALHILERGEITLAQFKGSWAGAMGQTQFMPSSFLLYAVDGDGDGQRDIWRNTNDVFGSIANYLRQAGWRADSRIRDRINVPSGFDHNLAGADNVRPLSEWRKLGITPLSPNAWVGLPDNEPVSIILPDGPGGDAYMAYHNFRVILKWNRSSYFALAVAKLADSVGEF